MRFISRGNHYWNEHLAFIKDKEYELLSVEHFIDTNNFTDNSVYMFRCEMVNKVNRYEIFSHHIYNYFYTKKELRKIKLEKLNGRSNI